MALRITLHVAILKNVTFSVAHTDMSQAIRLFSVWPTDFQYHSQAAATGYSCVAYVKMTANFTFGQTVQTLKEVESSVLEFTVMGPIVCRYSEGSIVRKSDSSTTNPNPNTSSGRLSDLRTIAVLYEVLCMST